QLVSLGFDVTIFSLRQACEPEVNELGRQLLPRARYAGTGAVLASQIWWLTRRPWRYLRHFARIAFGSSTRPSEALKHVGSAAFGAHFGRLMLRQGVQRLHAHWATYSATGAWTASVLTGTPFSITTHAHDLFLPDRLLERKSRDAQVIVTISEYN